MNKPGQIAIVVTEDDGTVFKENWNKDVNLSAALRRTLQVRDINKVTKIEIIRNS